MHAFKAENVCRSYGRGAARTEVLRGLDLALEPGAFEALMGPSGSGKSTLLHLAAGLIVPDSGRIFVGGCEVTAMGDSAAAKFRRRHVGVVFQDFNLIDALDVAANIVLPAKLDGARPSAARLGELLEKLGLSGLEKRRPQELSGGERQRVAVARALYAKPDVILADEPTGNLDAPAARGLCDLLKSLDKTEKSAILLVTHDPVVAACAAKTHFLKDGRIAASFAPNGDPAAVSSRYLETYG